MPRLSWPASEPETTLVYGRSVRSWLQWLGTEVGRRGVAEDLWADRACDVAAVALEDVVVVSDGRFRNELDVPRSRLDGRRQVCAVLVRRPTLVPPGLEAHQSEREVYEMAQEHDRGAGLFDVIYNDRGLDALTNKARNFAESLAR